MMENETNMAAVVIDELDLADLLVTN